MEPYLSFIAGQVTLSWLMVYYFSILTLVMSNVIFEPVKFNIATPNKYHVTITC